MASSFAASFSAATSFSAVSFCITNAFFFFFFGG
jgi:hypothetical protein